MKNILTELLSKAWQSWKNGWALPISLGIAAVIIMLSMLFSRTSEVQPVESNTPITTELVTEIKGDLLANQTFVLDRTKNTHIWCAYGLPHLVFRGFSDGKIMQIVPVGDVEVGPGGNLDIENRARLTVWTACLLKEEE